jgi:hypothetical protein
VAVAVAVAVVAVAVAVDSWMSLSNRWHEWFFVNVAHPKLTLKRFLRVFSRQTNHWHAKIDCFFTSKSIVFLDKIYHVQGSVGTIFVNGSAPAQTATGTVEIGKKMFRNMTLFFFFFFSSIFKRTRFSCMCLFTPTYHALTLIFFCSSHTQPGPADPNLPSFPSISHAFSLSGPPAAARRRAGPRGGRIFPRRDRLLGRRHEDRV